LNRCRMHICKLHVECCLYAPQDLPAHRWYVPRRQTVPSIPVHPGASI
jgi:hypothetical protein